MATVRAKIDRHGAEPKSNIFLAAFFAIAISFCWQVYHWTDSFAPGDCTANLWLVTSLAEDGDFNLRNQLQPHNIAPLDAVALGKHGEWYSVHESLLSLVAAPLYRLFGLSALYLIGPSLFAFSAIIVFWLGERVAATVPLLLCAIAVLAQTDDFLLFSNETMGACLILLSLYFIFREKLALAGFVASLVALARVSLCITWPSLLIFLYLRRRPEKDFKKEVFLFLMGMVPGVLLFLINNYLLFGSPLTLSYMRWMTSNGELLDQSKIFFSVSPVLGLRQMFFADSGGLFVRQPLLAVAAIFGLPILLQKDWPLAVTIIILSLSLFSLYATYPGIQYYPSRYFVLLQVLYIIPLACVADWLLCKVRGRAFVWLSSDAGGQI